MGDRDEKDRRTVRIFQELEGVLFSHMEDGPRFLSSHLAMQEQKMEEICASERKYYV